MTNEFFRVNQVFGFKNLMKNITLFWCLKYIIVGRIIKYQTEFWYSFLLEAVEASQCYFFENRLIKLKCPHLLKVLLSFLKLGSQLLLVIWDFKVCHIELEHPVMCRIISNRAIFSASKALFALIFLNVPILSNQIINLFLANFGIYYTFFLLNVNKSVSRGPLAYSVAWFFASHSLLSPVSIHAVIFSLMVNYTLSHMFTQFCLFMM